MTDSSSAVERDITKGAKDIELSDQGEVVIDDVEAENDANQRQIEQPKKPEEHQAAEGADPENAAQKDDNLKSTRRSLERVDSTKNLHSIEGTESVYKEDKDWLPTARDEQDKQWQPPKAVADKASGNKKQRYSPVKTSAEKKDKAQKIDKKMLILAPLESGNSTDH